MRSKIYVTAASLLLPVVVRTAATCYKLDGTEWGDSSYVPCDPDAEYSACCASNKGTRSDVCMSSGLCYAQDGNYRGFVYMNGCTDQTGLSADCPHFCPDATNDWNGGDKVVSWNILQCNLGVYCCRAAGDTTNCCSNSSAVITTDIGTLLLTTATATSTLGTAAATVTTTTTASASGQCSNVTASDTTCSSNKTAVVGGAVGGVLGAALLASLGALAFMIKRRKDEASPTPAAQRAIYLEQTAKPAQYTDNSYTNQPYVVPHELSTSQVQEMQ